MEIHQRINNAIGKYRGYDFSDEGPNIILLGPSAQKDMEKYIREMELMGLSCPDPIKKPLDYFEFYGCQVRKMDLEGILVCNNKDIQT